MAIRSTTNIPQKNKATMKKIHLSHKQRLVFYFLLSFVLYIIAVIVIQTSISKKHQRETKTEVAKTYLSIAQKELNNGQDINEVLKILPQNYRLTIINNKGSVCYDNIANSTANHNERPEIISAKTDSVGVYFRTSETTNQDYIYVATQLVNGNTIRIATPYEVSNQYLANIDNILLYIAVFVFFAAILLAIYFSDKFLGVMTTLKNFVASAEKGNVDYEAVHFPDTYSGEVGSKIISLYKQLEISKLQIIEEKDRNRKMKQEMTNNISHELKTPVSSIRGYLEILLGSKPVPDDKRQYFLERSYSQTLRLSNLINDVSIINKMEESAELFQKEKITIAEIANEAIVELEDKIQERNITIKNNISDSIAINGNHSLVYGIFRNLIENAVFYAGDNITIGMECHREDQNFYYFRFYDTGCGIDEKYITRIFDRFLRIDEGRSRKNGGTGLGLSIVKHAVLFHNGGIIAKNAATGGLEFFFSLEK